MDQDDENSIEEGELSNDSDNNYTPLERPPNYSAAAQPQSRFPTNLESESEEELESSDSDSDSDSRLKKSKKPKIKLKPKRHYKPEQKKYDIWSTRVQEDVLAETLNSCDVTTKDRSRSVESYDYTLGSKYYNNEHEDIKEHFKDQQFRSNNKRTRSDRNNMNFKPQRRRSPNRENVKGTERNILDLVVDENSNEEDLAKDIANKLYEEKEDLILNVINTIGKKKAIEIFEETKNIEKKGGMLIMNLTRRRTPGGVYLFLVRNDDNITQEQKNAIFNEEKQRNKLVAKQRQKDRFKKLKEEIASSKSKLLPELLSRAEAELLAGQNPTRKIKEQTEDEEVINPPPTPETDGHDNENSMDGPPLPVVNGSDSLDNVRGKLNTYDDDFLDIGCSADMDLF